MRYLWLLLPLTGCAEGGLLSDDDVSDDDAGDDDAGDDDAGDDDVSDDDAGDDDVSDDDAGDDDASIGPVLAGRFVGVPPVVPSGTMHVGAFLWVDGDPPQGALRMDAAAGPLQAGDWALQLVEPPPQDRTLGEGGESGAVYVILGWLEDGDPGYGPGDLPVAMGVDLLSWVSWTGERPSSVPEGAGQGWNLLRYADDSGVPDVLPIPDGTAPPDGPQLGPWLLPVDGGLLTVTFPETPTPAAIAALHTSLFDPPAVPSPVLGAVAASGTSATLTVAGPPPPAHLQEADGLRGAWYGIGLWYDAGADRVFTPNTCDTFLDYGEGRYLAYLDGHGLDPLAAIQLLTYGFRPGWTLLGDDGVPHPLSDGIELTATGATVPEGCFD